MPKFNNLTKWIDAEIAEAQKTPLTKEEQALAQVLKGMSDSIFTYKTKQAGDLIRIKELTG